jgi:hypothetical protein
MAHANLVFTRHAADMLIERGIDRAWVEATIRDPESIEPDPNRPGVFRAFRSIPAHGSRILRVVYAPTGNISRVLTVFFDRKRRQK